MNSPRRARHLRCSRPQGGQRSRELEAPSEVDDAGVRACLTSSLLRSIRGLEKRAYSFVQRRSARFPLASAGAAREHSPAAGLRLFRSPPASDLSPGRAGGFGLRHRRPQGELRLAPRALRPPRTDTCTGGINPGPAKVAEVRRGTFRSRGTSHGRPHLHRAAVASDGSRDSNAAFSPSPGSSLGG
jgi:hypothetical protein